MFRVAVGGFIHESNSFSPIPARLEDFRKADGWPPLVQGTQLPKAVEGMNLAINGFIDACQQSKLQTRIKPLLWCSAQPSGPVEDEAYDYLLGRLLKLLKDAMPLDAVFLDLHGAMITESYLDADGETLAQVREVIGSGVRLIVALDMHANVSGRMAEMADWIVGYRTYPHIDMAGTGKRAAEAMFRLLQHPVAQPVKFMRRVPYLIPVTQQCTRIEPMNGVMRLAQLYSPASGTVECFTGFPPGDTPHTTPTVLGYGFERDIIACTNDVADHWELVESAFDAVTLPAKEAVALAMKEYKDKPVILADTQDNPGAGGTGDTVGLLKALVDANVQEAVFACLYDPANATRAHALGEGTQAEFHLGSHSGLENHEALSLICVVEKLTDGDFVATGPMYGGGRMQLGPMACLRHGGVRIVLQSVKQQAGDRSILRHLGIEPEKQRILALKSSVHFRADFEPIAQQVIIALAPGLNLEDPSSFPYQNLPRGVRLKPRGAAFGAVVKQAS